MSDDDKKPRLEKRFGRWEVNTRTEGLLVCCCANEIIEIDKLFGPLAAHGVRVFLEYKDGKSDWVVQSEIIRNGVGKREWKERARWDCQDDWPEEEKDE